MDFDPSKVKEERENFLRENELLRQEREQLLARLEQMQTANSESATSNVDNAVDVDFDMGEFLQPQEVENDGVVITEHQVDVVDELEALDPNGIVIGEHQVVVVDEPKHTVPVEVHQDINALDHDQSPALGLQVAYDEFLEFQQFLNFKKFLNHQRQQVVAHQPIVQPIPQPVGQAIPQAAGEPIGEPIGQPIPQLVGQPIPQPVGQHISDSANKVFMTLPNGKVIEVIDVGNVSMLTRVLGNI